MGKVNCVHQPYHRPAAMLLGKGDRSPSLSPGAPYHHAHRMAVGLEVQSEKVEGHRYGEKPACAKARKTNMKYL